MSYALKSLIGKSLMVGIVFIGIGLLLPKYIILGTLITLGFLAYQIKKIKDYLAF
ncbi:MAG: hypothetical protein IPK08_17160 [Bacteroidetes bacterium]|nr:hypothetical protein [Bacteroidota bacterium]